MTPKVDTFQIDIADEIKRKDASLTSLASASNISDNKNTLPKKTPLTLVLLITFSIVSIVGIIGITLFYFNDSLLPPEAKEQPINPEDAPKVLADLTKISPELSGQIGRYVTKVEKKERGYILTLNTYSPVFAYMTRNEEAYIEDLTSLFSLQTATTTSTSTTQEIKKITATTTPSVASSTPPSSSTTASTSTKSVPKTNPKTVTQKSSSTTKTVPEEPVSSSTVIFLATENASTTSFFKDVTINNQNMRVYERDTRKAVYAFVGDSTVLISDTPEGVLVLKSAILR